MIRFIFITIPTLLFVTSDSLSSAEGRQKRIIHGEVLEERLNTGFSSPKYYVWIGFGKTISTSTWDYTDEVCGGGLLTTQIVQSACHCFADFQSPRKSGEEWHIRNTHKYQVQVGCSSVYFAKCKTTQISKYIIHPLCRKIFGWVSSDFALLTLADEIQLSRYIKTAPFYVIEDTTKIWSKMVSKKSVCMITGFGRYLSRKDPTSSKVLRYGWQAIMSYRECYQEYALQSTEERAPNFTWYQEYATWTCMQPFGRELGTGMEDETGQGDSGSPITCDNVYFALVSESGNSFNVDLTVVNDLVFYAYANAAYYRGIMTYEMLDKNNLDHCHRDHPVPVDTLIFPDTPPSNRLFADIASGEAHPARRWDYIIVGLSLSVSVCP